MGNCCENKEISHEKDSHEILVGSQIDGVQQAYNLEKPGTFTSQVEIKTEESVRNVENFEVKPDTYYTGEFMEQKANGIGTLKTKEFTYNGEFVNGRPSGKGKIVFLDGSEYEGDFVNGNSHGNGKFTKRDGFLYNGEFQTNRYHGKGISKWANGSSYKGEFFKGKFHGEGIYTYPDKKVYKGKFFNGQKDGEGFISFPGKTETFQSTWKEGVIIGPSYFEISGKKIKMQQGDEKGLGI